MGYGLDGGGSIPASGQTFFSLLHASKPTLGFTQWVLGSLSPGLKPPGREADSPPSSAEVKNCVTWYPLSHTSYGVMLNLVRSVTTFMPIIHANDYDTRLTFSLCCVSIEWLAIFRNVGLSLNMVSSRTGGGGVGCRLCRGPSQVERL
jgi:hypothetical protein